MYSIYIMLFQGNVILEYLKRYNIHVNGVIHIGAHECEEKGFYNDILGVSDEHIIWIDANTKKVMEMKGKGFTNIYQAAIDEEERDVVFNITDNSQASGILTLNHAAGFYNNINIVEQIQCRTEKLSNFLKRVEKDPSKHNFWNLDIQGTELHVLRGSKELLNQCDVIYTEVNQDYVYKGCGLIHELDTLLYEYGFKRVDTLWTTEKWGGRIVLKGIRYTHIINV